VFGPVTGVVLEKRVRSAWMPDVLFPSLTFPFVEFHCKYVRPAIREKGRESRFDADFSSCGNEERMHDRGSDISGARQTCSIVQHDFEDEEKLLLHTETGLPLNASHVRSTWKRFLCHIDPELFRVTQMFFRASSGTYMIQQYRIGAHFRDLTEPELLDRLAAMMNTSLDMLAQVYGACNLGDYRSTCNEMMRVYEQHNPKEYDDEEDVRRHAPEMNFDKF
jgi:hypothetical protein